MVGDSLSSNAVSQADAVDQLSKKLGLKVVLQMENSEGEVVFEDIVSSANNSINHENSGK